MANKQYLDQEGLERLVSYINAALLGKADNGVVPEDVVRQDDLIHYIDEDEIIGILENYATNESLNDVVREAALADYATNESLSDVVREAVLEDYATNNDLADLREEVSGLYHFKGSVANLEALTEIQNPSIGDTYNISDTGMNAAWTGEEWDEFGSVADLSDYLKEEEVNAITLSTVNSILYGGNKASVTDIAGIKAMLDNSKEDIEIKITDNIALSETITIPNGKNVILDLGGNTMSSNGIIPIAINGGEVTIKNGEIKTIGNVDAIFADDGASVIIDDADIVSGHNGISARDGSSVTMNSGSITSQEAGIAGFKNSTVIMNGGEIIGLDNGAVMGNGSPAGSDNDGSNFTFIMNGGKLIGHIQSAGYIACGVYIPNSGVFTMNGGEIKSDGCGICMRGGEVNIGANAKIIATGASGVTGKVGDSRVVIGPYAIVYDAHSKYPGVDTLELNIEDGADLVGTDGDIDIILASGMVANIHDNRA